MSQWIVLKSPRIALYLLLALVLAVGMAWKFWPAKVVVSEAKPSTPRVVEVTKPVQPVVAAVEIPKVAPVKPSDVPPTADEVQAQKLMSRARTKQQMQNRLEQQKTKYQQVYAQKVTEANGNPATLAKIEDSRIQMEQTFQNMQNLIDEMDKSTAPN